MAMNRCSVCGQELGETAPSCPYCGSPVRAPRKGTGFEWKSRASIFGIPLVHVAFGSDSRGKVRVAKGFVAVGQFAFGGITFAQFGIGILFGFGQLAVGIFAVGQMAVSLIAAIGQLAVGLLAVGQVVAGLYGLGQIGWARYLWSPDRTDMEAVALFHTIYLRISQLLVLG